MKLETLGVSHLGQPTPSSQTLGLTCEILSKSTAHGNHKIQHLLQVVMPAIRHRQLQLLFDESGNVVAYVAWAAVTDDVEARFVNEKQFRLHESEWNEGEIYWIIDFAIKAGYLNAAKDYLTKTTFRNLPSVRYMRKCRGRLRLFEFRHRNLTNAIGVEHATNDMAKCRQND